MASSSTAMDLDEPPAGGSKTPGPDSKSAVDPVLEDFKTLKERIYNECWDGVASGEETRNTVFSQTDLMDLGIIPESDIEVLLQIVQALVDEKKFKAMSTSPTTIGWCVRSEDEAKT
jgi:hypothetical protein